MSRDHIGELLYENQKDVEKELKLVSSLRSMFHCPSGQKISTAKAKEVYSYLHENGITFKTSVGHAFLEEVCDVLTVSQREALSKQVIEKSSRKKAFRANKPILIVFTTMALLTCLVYFGVYFYQDLKTYSQAKKLEEILVTTETAKEYNTSSLAQNTEKTKEEEIIREFVIQEKFTELKKINPDIVGWLSIDGMTIDYPVMTRENDNHYYLKHNFYGEEDRNGLLILDYRCDQTETCENLIIYGHNMKTGVMFGTLKKYKDASFAQKHKYIDFQGLYEDMRFEVVAVMLSRVAYQDEDVFRYYDAIDVSTMDNYLSFFNYVSENAIYESGVEHDFGDTFLMLSTCDYTEKDGRLVVIAKKCKE